MSEHKPFISPPADADGLYKYYLLGGVRPIRVTCNATGTKIFTEAPDPADGGNLRPAALLAPIMKDEDVEDITKQQFVELCQRAVTESGRN